ncbi:universal stress protein [Paraburkholderia sp. J8-2]|uniref:universal stress protein n=1 Tax=Paraburkholderia sp. J8-2 TaxID=2805440 RepID=UPI002AB71669|nr:universal stress protein [Paraburkholderia sp. J8-2]
MLKILIPIFDRRGAAEAARHSAFLFAEHCVAEVEIVEVLEDVTIERTSAFWSEDELREKSQRYLSHALGETCAILADAGVPYTASYMCGPFVRSVSRCVERGHADIVVVDASHLGMLSKLGMLVKLWRLRTTPVTLLN